MITSVSSTQETLKEIFAKLNNPSNINTKSASHLNTLKTQQNKSLEGTLGDLSIDFQQSLMALLNTKTNSEEKDNNATINDKLDTNENKIGYLGAPAGLDLEYNLSSQSLTEKLNTMSFMKMFDFDKDGDLTKNDFNVAKEKSPLIKNITTAFEDGKISGVFQNMINQYKDAPMSFVQDAIDIFA